MPRKELAVIAAGLAFASAAVPAEQLVQRQYNAACGPYSSCLTQYFTGGAPSASSFCSSFLSYSTSTVTATSTSTPPQATTTTTVTSTTTTSQVSTTTTTTTTTVTPSTTTSTSTSYCPVSGNGPAATKRAALPEPWGYQPSPSNSCNQYQCTQLSSPPSGSSCGAPGFLTAPSLIKVTFDRSVNACRDSCLGNSQCQSFSYFNSFGPCQLFSKPISQMKLWQPSGCANSPLQHYDLSCYSCKQQTTSTAYPTATSNPVATGLISSGCSCLGVTSPAPTTTTTTTTLAQQTTTATSTSTVTTTTYTSTSTVTQTSTSTAATPSATATFVLPNTYSGNYTAIYGGTFAEIPNTDFNGNDLVSGECYGRGAGFMLADGSRVPCKDYYGCQDVCDYINKNGGYNGQKCGALTYHPNPNGPNEYTTCYLKTTFPIDNSGYCGEISQGERRDSAVTFPPY